MTLESLMLTPTAKSSRKFPAGYVITDQESKLLFRSIMSSYIGTYTVEGNRVTHAVDLSWNESWTGGRLVRCFSVEGDTLTIETTPRTSGSDTREFINTLTWQRVEAFK